MALLDVIEAEVVKIPAVRDSVIALLNILVTKIEELKQAAGDPVKAQALADEIKARMQEITDAVVANTPADDTPPA